MSPTRRDPKLAPWRRLGESLAGSFAARAGGLLASEFAIWDREGEDIGRLRLHGAEGAELEVGGLEARIERSALTGYTMLAEDATILASVPAGALDTPEIRCLDRLYKGRLSLLRNTARAGPASGTRDDTTMHINGGLTNRNYNIFFETGDEGALPVALFLLYRLVSLRREAYRAS